MIEGTGSQGSSVSASLDNGNLTITGLNADLTDGNLTLS
jgi:hypothetical protein